METFSKPFSYTRTHRPSHRGFRIMCARRAAPRAWFYVFMCQVRSQSSGVWCRGGLWRESVRAWCFCIASSRGACVCVSRMCDFATPRVCCHVSVFLFFWDDSGGMISGQMFVFSYEIEWLGNRAYICARISRRSQYVASFYLTISNFSDIIESWNNLEQMRMMLICSPFHCAAARLWYICLPVWMIILCICICIHTIYRTMNIVLTL